MLAHTSHTTSTHLSAHAHAHVAGRGLVSLTFHTRRALTGALEEARDNRAGFVWVAVRDLCRAHAHRKIAHWQHSTAGSEGEPRKLANKS